MYYLGFNDKTRMPQVSNSCFEIGFISQIYKHMQLGEITISKSFYFSALQSKTVNAGTGHLQNIILVFTVLSIFTNVLLVIVNLYLYIKSKRHKGYTALSS